MTNSTTMRRKPSQWRKPLRVDSKDRALTVLCRDFMRSGRVLSGNYDMTVDVMSGGNAESGGFPAWTERATNIHVNRDMSTPMVTFDDFAVMQGLLDHELAHVMFTPTQGQMDTAVRMENRWAQESMLAGALRKLDPGFMMAYNILEDQRIETLLIAEYPTMKEYLMLCFLHFIMGDGSKMPDMFFFTRGRRYLPRRIRMRARRKFKSPDHVEVIAEIIDEYRRLNLRFGKDLETAYHLVIRFKKIMYEINPPDSSCVCTVATMIAGSVKPLEANPERDKADRAKTSRILAKVDKAENDQQADDDADGGDGSGVGGGTGKGAGVGDDDSDDGAGTGGDKPDNQSQSDGDALKEVRKAISGSERVKADMREIKRVVKALDDLDHTTPRQIQWEPKIPRHIIPLMRKTMVELRRVEEDSDPHWKTHTTTGRLNMGRAMRADPGDDDLYDTWAEGMMVGTDMELVVLLDASPSMSNHFVELSYASWVIKRACDQLRITCTQMAYANSHTIVYGPKDRASERYPWIRQVGGGTQPGSALIEAHRVLARSRKRHRSMVVLTDGAWTSTLSRQAAGQTVFSTCEDVIDDMNVRGILTALVYLGTDDNGHGAVIETHNCQVYRTISDVTDLPLFVRDQLVRELRRTV